MKAISLYELNNLVRGVIETTLDRPYWVEAELSEAREVRGHCYMELVQKDEFSTTPIARASAKCWHSVWMRLKPRFEQVTGQSIHAGMKVLLLVTASFHEAYGFAWIVQDIDPTYTMGDMARKRQEIIRQLKAEGIFDLQRQLDLPLFAQHIAVISSEQAAGYGDFCNQLDTNDYGFRFSHTLFPAVMQGEQVESSIIRALNDIFGRADDFDAVVIIRGGGATADMSGFDTLALAENVANFPLPIITGIGHERDESILDMISFQRVKTPTAAAAFLIDHLAETDTHLQMLGQRMVTYVNTRMQQEHTRLEHLSQRIPMLFSLVKTRQGATLDRLSQQISSLMGQRVAQARYRVELLQSRLAPATRQRLVTEQHRLEQLSLRLKAVDPQVILQRGYSLTTFNGKAVRDASVIKPGDTIVTRLAKGQLTSIVQPQQNKNQP